MRLEVCDIAPESWDRKEIAGVCTRVTSGGTPSRKHPEYFGGSIPWVKTQELRDVRISSTEEHLTPEGLANSSAKLLPAHTILVAMYGATAGQLGILEHDMTCNQAACALVVNEDRAHYRYLYYQLLNARRQIKSLANGAAQQNLSAGTIKTLEVPFPSIAEQRHIGELLGALDDKIECNQRIADNSIALARHLYRGWRAGADDWPATTIGEFADVFGGSTPRTSEESYWDGEIAWATPTDVTALSAPYLFDTARHITDAGLAASSTQLHPAGSIFMTSRATIGAFAMNVVPCSANQGFVVVRVRHEEDRCYLFHELESRVRDFLDLANGSTFLEISRTNFKGISIPAPPRDALRKLAAELAPLHHRAHAAAKESRSLEAMRDALLPRLMSGQLRLKDAEVEVEAIA